jgi:hypothetical protein
MIAFLNPKLAVFMLALFAPFITADQGLGAKALLVLTIGGIDALWYSAVVLVMVRTRTAVGRWSATRLRRAGVRGAAAGAGCIRREPRRRHLGLSAGQRDRRAAADRCTSLVIFARRLARRCRRGSAAVRSGAARQ